MNGVDSKAGLSPTRRDPELRDVRVTPRSLQNIRVETQAHIPDGCRETPTIGKRRKTRRPRRGAAMRSPGDLGQAWPLPPHPAWTLLHFLIPDTQSAHASHVHTHSLPVGAETPRAHISLATAEGPQARGSPEASTPAAGFIQLRPEPLALILLPDGHSVFAFQDAPRNPSSEGFLFHQKLLLWKPWKPAWVQRPPADHLRHRN